MTQACERSQEATAPAENSRMRVGVFIAVMSENDVATPFWIAKVISLPDKNASSSQEIGVRWFQASGSASDPYDAAYTPSVRKQDKNGATYWETSVFSSQVFYIFDALTSENRIDTESAQEIKSLLYQ